MSGPAVMCRFCGGDEGDVVLDLGEQPACDHFPRVDDTAVEPVHPLRLWLCAGCGLAQVAEDPTVPDEPRAVEPQALVDQAREAVAAIVAAGLAAPGMRLAEYGSPHGGSWVDDLVAHGLRPVGDDEQADLIVDCLGLMHEADQAGALAARARRLAPGGTFVVEFHGLGAVITHGQWNQARHGHPVALSATALCGMLASVGLVARSAWWYPLYGGTVMLAARRDGVPDRSLDDLLAHEAGLGVTDPAVLCELQRACTETADALTSWLADARVRGRRVIGYGAASRAVPLLNRAGIGPDLVEVVADASPAKHGRRMPGVGIPIVGPEVLGAGGPLDVLLFVPDLLDEVRARYPQIEAAGGSWVVTEPMPRVVARGEGPPMVTTTEGGPREPAGTAAVGSEQARRRADEVRDADLDAITDELADELRRMSGQRLLITGGAGFLGYYLVQVPLRWNDRHPGEAPIEVTVWDNGIRGRPAWLDELAGRVDLTVGDVDLRLPLPPEVAGFAWIIHAAGIASPQFYRANPIATMDANITGLRQLLDATRERRAAGGEVGGFLFYSSSEIYGDPDPGAIPTPETYRGFVSCTGPRACYDESKRYGETLCVNFAQQYELPIRIARPFNNYGPGLKITDGRVIPDLCRDVLAGRNPVLMSDGAPTRTFCYASDAITGYYRALLCGRDGEPYNIGTAEPEVSMRHLAQRCASLAGELFGTELEVEFGASQEKDYLVDNPNRRCPDMTKSATELGYVARVGLDEGLRRTLLWYAGHPGDGTGA